MITCSYQSVGINGLNLVSTGKTVILWLEVSVALTEIYRMTSKFSGTCVQMTLLGGLSERERDREL